MLAAHAGQHHVVLQALARRFVTEIVKAEIALELVTGVMGGGAIAALGLPAGGVAQFGDQQPHLGELVPHPGRQH